jgi:hypothetical protein
MSVADHISQSTFKVKNTWRYNSPTPYVFVWCLIKHPDNCSKCFKAIFMPLGGKLKRSVCSDSFTSRPDHDQQHCYHRVPTVKPEAATAVVELLMMGVMTPETC